MAMVHGWFAVDVALAAGCSIVGGGVSLAKCGRAALRS